MKDFILFSGVFQEWLTRCFFRGFFTEIILRNILAIFAKKKKHSKGVAARYFFKEIKFSEGTSDSIFEEE